MSCTSKKTWQSRYGGGLITDAQFLAESMVARKARHEKRGLPLGFWELPKWKREFLHQISLIHKLLDTFTAGTIIRALRRPEARNIYSFGAPFLLPIIQKQLELELRQEAEKQETPIKEAEEAEEVEKPTLPAPPRPTFVSKKSALSKLRDLHEDAD